MKKVLSVVLAVAMVLACVASLAFVVGAPGEITTPTNSALRVEDFHVTDILFLKEGINPFTDLTDLDGNLYDKNSAISFALTLAVYNPLHGGGVAPTAPVGEGVNYYRVGNMSTLTFKSETVDFGLAAAADAMLFFKPFATTISDKNGTFVPGLANVQRGPEAASTAGVRFDRDTGDLELDVYYYTTQRNNNELVTPKYAAEQAGFNDRGLHLFGVSNGTGVEKTEYTLVFTGVTKGETSQEGLVTVEREDKASQSFKEGKGEIIVTKNGRTYKIRKYYSNGTTNGMNGQCNEPDAYTTHGLRGDFQWLARYDASRYNILGTTELYDVDAVAYEVGVLVDNLNNSDPTDDIYGIIGRFETEQVRYNHYWGEDLVGKDVPTHGISLGLDYYLTDGTGKTYGDWLAVNRSSLESNPTYFVYNKLGVRRDVYTSGYGADKLISLNNYQSVLDGYSLTAREALTNFLSDFGFGTGSEYSYKIQDSNFVEAATYEELGRATYNGNAIVIEQPEEDPDVEEPTGDEEVPDEGDIDEELPDEGDIDEEPIPDEPVPETGDASAAVAVALTAAALVAAAGLAVVLKKAR